MSRIGKLPVKMIDGVQVTIAEDNLVTVKGPKGTLTKQLHPDMVLTQEVLPKAIRNPWSWLA